VESLARRGCHRLIRDGARLVETVGDTLDKLGQLRREVRTAADEPSVRHPAELALTDQERSLLGQLDNRPSGVDELITLTGLTSSQVMATVSVLELKRLIKRLPRTPVRPGVMLTASGRDLHSHPVPRKQLRDVATLFVTPLTRR
jgi:DNA processing protein